MKKKKRGVCTAIIVAAGSGSRMGAAVNGSGVNKIFVEINDAPVLAHTLTAFEQCAAVDDIVIVTRECDIVDCKAICDDFGITKLTTIVTGGETRQQSVVRGLDEVAADVELVAIHDAARCLITPEDIDAVVRAAYESGAAAPGVPCKDSLKQVDSAGYITATIERDGVWQVQTPQVFGLTAIKAAHQSALQLGISATDDCDIVQRFGIKVKMVMGSYSNIKITTPEDIAVAEALMAGE